MEWETSTFPVGADTNQQHPGRIYAALLGGKNVHPADAAVAKGITDLYSASGLNALASVWSCRHFMQRSAWWLAAECGIRQFLDIGCGSPMSPNLPEIVQHAQPDARIVSVDTDPVALRYAEASLRSSPQGRSVYLHADLTDPASILAAPEVAELLDFSQPVALCLNSMLGFVPDSAKPYEKVAELVDALSPGSYVTIAAPTADFQNMDEILTVYNQGTLGEGLICFRSRDEILKFVAGLELVEPGITPTYRWRPDLAVPDLGDGSMLVVDSSRISDVECSNYAVVARK